MFLGLFNIFLSLFCILEGRACVVIYLDEVGALLVNLTVDVFRDRVDVCHKLFDIVELILPLTDDFLHVSSLSLYFELFTIEHDLLLHKTAFFVMARSAAIVAIVVALMAIDKVNVLLHLQVDLALELRRLGRDLCHSLSVGFLLFLLLLLGSIGHTYVTVVVNKLLQLLLLIIHVLHLLDDALPKIVAVPVGSNLFFLLPELCQVVLEASHVTLNLLVCLAHLVWDERLEQSIAQVSSSDEMGSCDLHLPAARRAWRSS